MARRLRGAVFSENEALRTTFLARSSPTASPGDEFTVRSFFLTSGRCLVLQLHAVSLAIVDRPGIELVARPFARGLDVAFVLVAPSISAEREALAYLALVRLESPSALVTIVLANSEPPGSARLSEAEYIKLNAIRMSFAMLAARESVLLYDLQSAATDRAAVVDCLQRAALRRRYDGALVAATTPSIYRCPLHVYCPPDGSLWKMQYKNNGA